MGALPVSVTGCERRFGARLALSGVDLEVAAGEIVGLAGPNGSGKTTLLKILSGFLRPSAGEVRVFGLEPYRDQPRVMERARFAFAPPALFETLTAKEHLVHLSRLRPRGVPAPGTAEIRRALARVGLEDRAGDCVRTFSFGMRQRLVLAQALLPRPELLVLDEPTDGLDPLAVLELRGILAELRREEGLAILLSSHLLIELEELVDRLLVLREGTPLFHGTPAEMVAGGRELRLSVDDSSLARRVLAERGLTAEDRGEHLALPPGSIPLSDVAALLASAGATLTGYVEHRPALEEALLQRLRREEGDGRR